MIFTRALSPVVIFVLLFPHQLNAIDKACLTALQIVRHQLWQRSAWDDDAYITTSFSLDDKTYSETRDLSLNILGHCKSHCIVVGIGRSPTPLIAFMQGYRPGSAINLPLTNFRYRVDASRNLPFPYNKDHVKENFRSLTSEEEKKLFAHFDQFVLPHLTQDVRELTITDVSEVGASAMAAQLYLAKYLTMKKLNVKLSSVIVSEPKFEAVSSQIAQTYGVNRPRLISVSPDSETYKRFNDAFYGKHEWSEYSEYTLGNSPSRNSKYVELVNVIASRTFLDPSVPGSSEIVFLPPDGLEIDRRSRTVRSIGDPKKIYKLLFQ